MTSKGNSSTMGRWAAPTSAVSFDLGRSVHRGAEGFSPEPAAPGPGNRQGRRRPVHRVRALRTARGRSLRPPRPSRLSRHAIRVHSNAPAATSPSPPTPFTCPQCHSAARPLVTAEHMFAHVADDSFTKVGTHSRRHRRGAAIMGQPEHSSVQPEAVNPLLVLFAAGLFL